MDPFSCAPAVTVSREGVLVVSQLEFQKLRTVSGQEQSSILLKTGAIDFRNLDSLESLYDFEEDVVR